MTSSINKHVKMRQKTNRVIAEPYLTECCSTNTIQTS